MGLCRRRFLFLGLGGLFGAVTAVASAVPRSPSVASTGASVATIAGVSPYGSAVRAKVFEVIVRQGLAGRPWRQDGAEALQVNHISEAEVEAEIERRKRSGVAPEVNLAGEHFKHEGYVHGCPGCIVDWHDGRPLRLENGKYKWLSF